MDIRKTKYLGILGCTLMLSACATQKVAISESIQQKSAQAASKATFTPEQAIVDAEIQLIKAKEFQLDFFAPIHIEQAAENIAQAREYIIDPPSDIRNAALMAAIAAQNFISDAYKNKKLVEGHLKEALQHQKVLIALGSPSILASGYLSVIETLTYLIKEIEQGNTSEAVKGQVDLIKDMSQVEIDTLKKIHLTEAEAYFEKAEDIDADDYAEQSFEKAEIILAASINFIEKNYRNREGVKQAGKEALWATKKAYFIGLESGKIIQMTAADSEKHILNITSLMNKVFLEGYGNEMPPQNLFNASVALVDMVRDLKKQHTTNETVKLVNSNNSAAVQIEPGTPVNASIQDDNEAMMPQSQKLEIHSSPEIINNIEEKIVFKADEQGFDSVESVETAEPVQ